MREETHQSQADVNVNSRTSSQLAVKETLGGQQRHMLLAAILWSPLHLVLGNILVLYVYKVQHSETGTELLFILSAESAIQISCMWLM